MNTSYSSISNPANLPADQLKIVERNAFRDGIKACMPAVPGIMAWGLVAGIAMIKANFTIAQALGMTLMVFAGSAQLAALPLIAMNTPIWVIFLTCLVINLRFVIFSMIFAPHFSYLPLRQRILWSYLTADVSIIFFTQRYPTVQPKAGKFDFLKGVLLPNWVAWQIGSIAGIFLGNAIPDDWNIGYAGTLAILCLLLPMLLSRATLVGVIVTGIIAILTLDWPYKLGMLLAVVVGMLCSMAWEERGN